jgi:hypothetical protein
MSCTLSARLVAVTTISSNCCAATAGARPTVSAAITAASGFGEYLRARDAFKLPVLLVIRLSLLSASDVLFFSFLNVKHCRISSFWKTHLAATLTPEIKAFLTVAQPLYFLYRELNINAVMN